MPYSDPEKQRAAQREYARRRRTASQAGSDRTPTGNVEPLLPPTAQMDSADDVIDMLARHLRAIDASQAADVLMKGRVAAQVAGSLLRAIDARDAARIRDVEQRIENAHVEVIQRYGATLGAVIRMIFDELILSPEQTERAPEVVVRALARYSE